MVNEEILYAEVHKHFLLNYLQCNATTNFLNVAVEESMDFAGTVGLALWREVRTDILCGL